MAQNFVARVDRRLGAAVSHAAGAHHRRRLKRVGWLAALDFIFLGGVVLLLLALAARLGKRRILFALAVPVAVAVQIVLAWISESVHGVGPLHGINALVVFGLTGYLTGQAWRGARVPSAAAQPTPAG